MRGRGIGRALALGALAATLGARPACAADEEPLPEVATALARIRDASTIDLTTRGRKTGKEHTRPIWFVVDGGKLVVQAGSDGKTDWYRNLVQQRAATVRQGKYTFRVRATPIEDPQRAEHIHAQFREKYLSARVLSFFGSSIGHGRPVELTPDSVSVSH